ncbi:hypothetical protein IW139_000254 [Coemansia sp. RSA 353]|nr:hypothetical protein GGH15_000963 [Coemansia sp. RSA 562]KAJ2191630.1 hypothetical protein EV181_000145 [Coemansia sp. RSA 532]KAJ2209192.1 hypothetical protein IW145_000136 [Coemansia sp. RSA 521]KAJ2231617.1 hypothetical protein EV180_000224 [Coemansia sp. RSA 518]KAJ2278990.1 hypothetical protein J3F81_000186 [Coemansia sp. RSA 371]KAJ2284491.1 hypothetical protein GGH14_000038 [Coemansia sp. RSA 370]KAJ2294649.1 hypothetical protein IW141_000224 [Coemansia sp. RSA 355]KAJ2301565.1 hyp
MKCVYRIACLAVLGSVMATPDVTGTKTVLISLATGEHGEIIPFVLTSNSNGLVPVELSTVASVEPVGWVDTDVQGVAPSANSMDSVKEGDLELEESSDYVMLAENTDIESEGVESAEVESAEVESAETESADVESAETESAEDVSAEEAVPAEESISPEDAPIQDTTLDEASNIDDQAEYDSDSDSDSDDTASKPSQSSAHTPTTLLTFSLCIIALTF